MKIIIYQPVLFFLINMLIFRIFLLISSNRWLLVWFSFEFNILIFIPFLKNKFYLFRTESILKYFVLQRICSILIILIWLIFKKSNLLGLLIFIKIGLPPFHYWVIDFLKINHWLSYFLLITIQKIGLIIILFYFIFNKIFFYRIIFLFLLIRILSVLFLSNIIYIIIYSSFIHNCWIINGLFFSIKIFIIYFVFYILISYYLLKLFEKINQFYFSQLFYSFKWWVIWIIIGLPPFSIFLIKWSISIFLIKWSISIFLIILFSSIIIIYIYIKYIYLNFLNKNSSFLSFQMIDNYKLIFLTQFLLFYVIIIL